MQKKATVPTGISSGTARGQMAPRRNDEKRPLSVFAQCPSLRWTACGVSSSFQYYLRETGSEVMSSTDPRKTLVDLQGHLLGGHVAGDGRFSNGNLG